MRRPLTVTLAAGLTVILVLAALRVPGVPGTGAARAQGLPATVPGRWHRFTADSSPLPGDDVRFVSVDASGSPWLRVAAGPGEPDRVVAVTRSGDWRVYERLEEAVEANAPAVLGGPSVGDFWALEEGRAWTGTRHFDGQQWRSLVSGEEPLQFAARALADPEATVWVPFADCPLPDVCDAEGVAAFAPDGPIDRTIRFELAADASRYGVADVHLLPRHPDGRSRPLDAWAVARRALYALPDATPVRYPLLEPAPPPAPRNAGYATAAALTPDGRLMVVTWVEVDGESGVEHKVLANTWADGAWAPPGDLTGSPLFRNGAASVRVIAVAFDGTGTGNGGDVLWLGSSEGEIAAARAGEWVALFTRDGLGLPPEARIAGMAVDRGGILWVATSHGLLAYTPPRVLDRQAFVPLALRGW